MHILPDFSPRYVLLKLNVTFLPKIRVAPRTSFNDHVNNSSSNSQEKAQLHVTWR